ncbi:MAG: GDP-mannose 4,6-dehydratase [bacterium]
MEKDLSPTLFVTGAAGFIGSHICDMLLESGHSVVGLDNFDPYYPRAEKEKNLRQGMKNAKFSLVEGDIRDAELVSTIFRKNSLSSVVHLAARAGVRASLLEPEEFLDVNIRGTAVLLEAARKAGVRDFIFASSSSVYGDRSEVPFRESDRTDHPLSPYGASKKAGEALCYTYHHLYGLSIACLRFFTVYGPRQRPDLAIRKFTELALADRPIPVFGDGSSRRDYTHIRDILSGVKGAMDWCTQSVQPRYGIFNLGSNSPVTLESLLQHLEEILQKPLQRDYHPPQPGDVFQTYADTTLAESELGFRRTVSFKEGLADFCHWLIRQNE